MIYRNEPLLNLCSDDMKRFIMESHEDFAQSTGMSVWHEVTDEESGETLYFNEQTKLMTSELPADQEIQDETLSFCPKIPNKIKEIFWKLPEYRGHIHMLISNKFDDSSEKKSDDDKTFLRMQGEIRMELLKNPIMYLSSILLASNRNVLLCTQDTWKTEPVTDVDVIAYSLDETNKQGMLAAIQDTRENFTMAGFIIVYRVKDMDVNHIVSAFSCFSDILICNSWGSECQLYDDFKENPVVKMGEILGVSVVMVKHPPPEVTPSAP